MKEILGFLFITLYCTAGVTVFGAYVIDDIEIDEGSLLRKFISLYLGIMSIFLWPLYLLFRFCKQRRKSDGS